VRFTSLRLIEIRFSLSVLTVCIVFDNYRLDKPRVSFYSPCVTKSAEDLIVHRVMIKELYLI
jgi:hypothetical protein